MEKQEETLQPQTAEAVAPKSNPLFKAVGFAPVVKETKLKTEFVAGIVTFLAMAYILTVNPNQIFGEGSPYWASAFIATALGAVIGTLLMAFLAKMPLAQASGMGLNSMLGGIIGRRQNGTYCAHYGGSLLPVYVCASAVCGNSRGCGGLGAYLRRRIDDEKQYQVD